MNIDPHLDFFVSGKDKDGNIGNFHLNTDINGIDRENATKESILEVLKKLKTQKGFIINTYYGQYSIAEKYDIGEFNTLIDVNIPYCLHIPNGIEVPINIESEFGNIVVTLNKIWTVNALGSDLVDVVEETKDTYFNKASFTSAKMPQNPILGWQTKFTGINVDREKDNTGYFRYTSIRISFNSVYTKDDFDKIREEILLKIKNLTLDVINKLLDCYRYVTREEYVERILTPEITDIQFLNPNVCFMLPNGLHWGIGDALMNHSWGKIEAIKELLNSSDSPPIYDSLFLNAESAYNKKVYKMAVLESFQAFEIFLENYLIDKFVKNGLTYEKAIEKIVEGNNWRTPDRLKSVLHEAVGHKLTEDISLWQEWHDGYNEVRNEVIHRNKNISEDKTRKMLDANIKVFNWLNSL